MKKMENKKECKNASELSNILNDAMINLKQVIDINTVVGKPIYNEDGSVVVPVSKVYVGIVAGGGELDKKINKHNTCSYPFAGGTGAGFTISPIGFLVTKNNETTFVNTETDKSGEKLIEMTNKTLKIILENLKKD